MQFVNNNGVKIHYKVEGKGTPLVLQHGFTGKIENWYRHSYVDSLKQDYQLIFVELRGHGLSDKPRNRESYTLKIIASDVIAVLDYLGIDRAHFWGYSMGGNVGQGLIKYYADRFLSFILGGITPQAAEKEIQEKIDEYLKIFEGGKKAFVEYLTKIGVEITEAIEKDISNYDYKALAAFWGGDIFHDCVKDLQKLKAPCLLYVGEEDGWGHGPRAKEAARIIPNIEVLTFPNQGHDVQEKKELVLPHIINFLDKVS